MPKHENGDVVSFSVARQRLTRATQEKLEQARLIYHQHTISDTIVCCDLSGALAGQYNPNTNTIRYNLHIAATQLDAFIQRTVVHEVAHHVVAQVWQQKDTRWFSRRRTRIAPHGVQWKEVMTALGAVDLNRCHRYELDGVPLRRQKRYAYRCACRNHAVSAARHNRMRRGVQYLCNRCRQSLTLTATAAGSDS